jgi:hypothetical protein
MSQSRDAGWHEIRERRPAMGTIIYVIAILAVILAILGITFAYEPQLVTLNEGTITNIVSTLGLLAFIALIVERATEVIVAAWREPGRAARAVRIPRHPDSSETLGQPVERTAIEADLAHFKNGTLRIALLVGLAAGLAVSLIGIRTLEPIVHQGVLSDLAAQARWFRMVDVLLTGLAISGGSQAFHKAFNAWDNVMDRAAGRQE